MRALVTGASTFFATRLIQGFGARGVEVTAADSEIISVSKVSRYVRHKVKTPSLSRDPGGYLAAVVRELKLRHYDLVLPTFEESLLFAEFRGEIERHARLILPPFEVMWKLHHKPHLWQLCLELGIPTPPTVVPATPLGIEFQVADLRYPLVVKLPAANNCVGRMYCENEAELIEHYPRLFRAETEKGSAPPLIQQKIDGDPIYTLMLCQKGRKLGEVIYRPLRTYPENGGTSAHRETIHHPAIARISERLAAAVEWDGFLGLDFIVDRQDGTPYLIDANPRSNPAVHLGYLAGIDWTGFLMDMLEGRKPQPTVAAAGIRQRTPLLDIAWLLDGLRPGRGWWQNVTRHVQGYYNPGWSLDSKHDFLGTSDWMCHLALTYRGFSAAFKSFFNGQTVGQILLNDANYDPVTVEQLRRKRTIAGPHWNLRSLERARRESWESAASDYRFDR
jgi:predicted ATP-grasp superfamily ATP-dependent carboligase